MSNVPYSFTPVRRRDDTLNQQLPEYANSKVWTAARCHRLLRPIRARVELLRKERNLKISVADAESKHEKSPLGTLDIEGFDESDRSDHRDFDDDADWGYARKRVRRTYGGRHRRNFAKKTQSTRRMITGEHIGGSTTHATSQPGPGEVTVATPLLVRSRNTIEAKVVHLEQNKCEKSRRPQARYLTRDGDAHFRLAEELQHLKKTIDIPTFTLYDGIYNAVETLLKATNVKAQSIMSSRCGSTSLFSACLRVIPRRIKEEETWMEAHAKMEGITAFDIPDLTGEMYSQLEGLGTSVDGWQHLRLIVRAHGVQFVGEAVSEGLIDSRFASTLVMLCVHLESLKEAEVIIEALLSQIQHQAPSSIHERIEDYSVLLPLVTLQEYAKYTGRIGFYHRQLNHLLSTNVLPVTWLTTTHFSSTWTGIFKGISGNTANDQSTSDLLATALHLFATQMKDIGTANSSVGPLSRLSGTAFTSVLKTVLSIQLLKESTAHIDSDISISPRNACSLIGLFIQVMMRITAFETSCAVPKATACSADSLLFISTVLIMSGSWNEHEVRRDINAMVGTMALSSLRDSKGSSNANITLYICAIAKLCGKGLSNDGHEHLKLLVSRLQVVAQYCSDIQRTLKQIMVDAAYAFAQQSSQRAHLEYAESLVRDLYEPGEQLQEKRNTCSRSTEPDFRWEEGIGEWVTATPALKLLTKPKHEQNSTSGTIQITSPFSPLLRRRALFKSNLSRGIRGGSSKRARLSDMVPDTPDNAIPRTASEEQAEESSPIRRGTVGCTSARMCGLDDSGLFDEDEEYSDAAIACVDDSAIFLGQESDDELNASSPSNIRRLESRPIIEPMRNNIGQQASHIDERPSKQALKPSRIALTYMLDNCEDELGF